MRLRIIISYCFFSLLALTAEQIYSPTWGYALDLPESFALTNKEDTSRYLFQHSILPVDLQIALYKKNEFQNIQNSAEHIFKQLNMEHKDILFLWRNKNAILSSVNFVYAPSEKYQPKNLSGWLLSLELPNDSGWLIMLTYTDTEKAGLYEPLMISAIDTVFTDMPSYFEPGPVTTALYPKTGTKEIEYSFNNATIKFNTELSDAQANQSVIDREFALLTFYLKHEHVYEAWKRYYRVIFRDAWSRLYPASSAIQSFFFNSAHSLTNLQIASEVLRFVQNFIYERDRNGADFMNLPQAFLEKRGDCDSRALLMILILKQLNIDAILLVSPAKSHAIAAIDCQTGGNEAGNYFTHNGKQYLLAETTSHTVPGEIVEKPFHPEDWFPVDFYLIDDLL